MRLGGTGLSGIDVGFGLPDSVQNRSLTASDPRRPAAKALIISVVAPLPLLGQFNKLRSDLLLRRFHRLDSSVANRFDIQLAAHNPRPLTWAFTLLCVPSRAPGFTQFDLPTGGLEVL